MPTSLTQTQWKQRYRDLRTLVNNPDLAVSGPFVRVHDFQGEYIYNALTNRVIALRRGKTLKIQNESIYNEALAQLYPDCEIEHSAHIQAEGVRIFGQKLTRKEAAYAAQPQPTKQRPNQRPNLQTWTELYYGPRLDGDSSPF